MQYHGTLLRHGARDGGLALGGPGHRVVAEEHAEVGCGPSSVKVASPIGVGVGC